MSVELDLNLKSVYEFLIYLVNVAKRWVDKTWKCEVEIAQSLVHGQEHVKLTREF